jgi:hypothetical protein
MSWDRELHVLEEAIRRLNAEYDAFLYGAASKPPVESRKHVEQMIRRLLAESADSAADRFRFATLQGRFNALGERWERLQDEKESGRRPGLYGHFTPERSPRTDPGANVRRSADVEEERQAAAAARGLFERYVAARRAKGESMEGYPFERFVQSLERERERLKERLGTAEIEFDVAERDGKVKLIARRSGAGVARRE